MSAAKAPPTPEEIQQWIEALRADHVSPRALVRVDMAADALRRAFLSADDYVECMELADRHLRAAEASDKAWVKSTVKALKAARDKGDALTSKLNKLGRPRVVEH